MANLRRSRLVQSDLLDAPAPTRPGGRRWSLALGAVTAVLLALAWFDGGQEPLHPIAQDIAVPGQAQ
jgi:hypothetical protein